ncbi:MAG: PHP domain-containing protein [Labilithrix sp.]|nr:PHP domain-containing protein [Labilithrix sp.]
MRSRSRFLRWCRPSFATAALLATLAFSGRAGAAPIVREGDVPPGDPDHFFIDFDVPAGIEEIEIRHDDRSDANILDWGLDDPDGYRGWGGGTSEPVIVNAQAASRAYVPGPIKPGKWRVVVGKAKVVASPAVYHVEIDLKAAATLAPVPRAPYVPPPPRKTETRFYAGDFHVHDRESTDSDATIEEIVALAKQRGLDFVELSDHNTITQLDFFNEFHAREPGFLLLPGIEFTTYDGHANAIGATQWVDHKIGQPGVTISGAADAILAQGAAFSINHPALDLGDQCIGCAWKHDLDPSKISAVEIATLGVRGAGRIFSKQAIAFWDGLLAKGFHVAPIGGSDDHKAGREKSFLPNPIGNPTTLVRARELSAAAIVEGVLAGATVVKLGGPTDPMIDLEAATTKDGEALAFVGATLGARSIVLRVKVSGRPPGEEHQLRILKNGEPFGEPIDVTGDPFAYEIVVDAPAQGEDRYRAEVLLEGDPLTVTSHIWLKLDPAGPVAAAPADDGGCNASGSAPPWTAALLLLVGVAAWRKGKERR